jgi:hypothetical protein
MAQELAIPEPSRILQRAHHGHIGMTITLNSLPYPENVVEHFPTDRIDGLQFLLRYALSHQHARGWIAPLTFLIHKGGNIDG